MYQTDILNTVEYEPFSLDTLIAMLFIIQPPIDKFIAEKAFFFLPMTLLKKSVNIVFHGLFERNGW